MKGIESTIKQDAKYRIDDRVFTGWQIIELLRIATQSQKIALVMSAIETYEPPTNPDSKYGLTH